MVNSIGDVITVEQSKQELSSKYVNDRAISSNNSFDWNEHNKNKLKLWKNICWNPCTIVNKVVSRIESYTSPTLKIDFITQLPKKGLDHVAENILSFLDVRSLCRAELVSKEWFKVVSNGMLWKKLIERKFHSDSLWNAIAVKRGWVKYLYKPKHGVSRPSPSYYRRLYPSIILEIDIIEKNWKHGKHELQRIKGMSENSKGVYCIQYDDHKIISGSRDNTIKIWDRKTLEQPQRVLTGHTGSVLCLQYDENVIISGSSDSTVRVWDIESGEMVNKIVHHSGAVLQLRFDSKFRGFTNTGPRMMVTCSKDKSIAVWEMVHPEEINLRRELLGHEAGVNAAEFDEKYIVSASTDGTIKIWSTSSCEFIKSLNGHDSGIACLQYEGNLVISGSEDKTIKLWDIGCGTCLRTLEGHEQLVKCIKFNDKRIISGSYDGKIKVWDLQAALDPRSSTRNLCINTLTEHSRRVLGLQFDEFQIVTCSNDDTILIWDFCPQYVHQNKS